MEAIRKEIGSHENENHWNLVRRREINVKKDIMSICFFKRKMAPDGRLIKHKSCLCLHVGMYQWGENY